MTGKTFLRRITNGEVDIIPLTLQMLKEVGSDYCLIGGLAVNAYAEPVISLDLDLVLTATKMDAILKVAEDKGFKVEAHEHSFNLKHPESDLRIQLQRDQRYQDFIRRAEIKDVLGYELKVSSIEDVLQGKLWAYQDPKRRKSKRQKDLADIYRLIEVNPSLKDLIPRDMQDKM